MAKPKALAAAGRRQHILEQAERLFAERGYHGAALSDIARAAGLGNPGLIHHFPSKAGLYRAVLEGLAADIEVRLAAALENARDPAARLRALLDVQLDWARLRPQALRLVQRELLDNAERIAEAHVLPLSGFIASGMRIIQEAQQAGLIAPGPAEVKLTFLIGALSYAATVRPTFRQMLKTRLLGSETAWLQAVAEDVLAALLASPPQAQPLRRPRRVPPTAKS